MCFFKKNINCFIFLGMLGSLSVDVEASPDFLCYPKHGSSKPWSAVEKRNDGHVTSCFKRPNLMEKPKESDTLSQESSHINLQSTFSSKASVVMLPSMKLKGRLLEPRVPFSLEPMKIELLKDELEIDSFEDKIYAEFKKSPLF